MEKNILSIVLLVVMVAIIVTLDILFFRDKFWERLAVNIGIVIVFVIIYFVFLRHL